MPFIFPKFQRSLLIPRRLQFTPFRGFSHVINSFSFFYITSTFYLVSLPVSKAVPYIRRLFWNQLLLTGQLTVNYRLKLLLFEEIKYVLFVVVNFQQKVFQKIIYLVCTVDGEPHMMAGVYWLKAAVQQIKAAVQRCSQEKVL